MALRIGSLSNTSTAAMPGRARFSAETRAFSSINSAREVLTIRAVGFMRARSAGPTMPRVASVSRRCSVSTSLVSKNSSRDAAASSPSARARVRDVSLPQTTTRMPKALA